MNYPGKSEFIHIINKKKTTQEEKYENISQLQETLRGKLNYRLEKRWNENKTNAIMTNLQRNWLSTNL